MFVGRKGELELLDKKINSNKFEFGIDYNIAQLGKMIASYFDEPVSFDSFESIFQYLIKRSYEKKIIIIIDEFTYLLSTNKEVLSIFQNIVDQSLLNSKIKLILSGSHVGMVEDALTYKKPLYGRTTFKIKLDAFDYYEASKFYSKINSEDKVRLYSVFGGVPFYASKIDETKSVKENIMDLFLDEGAIFEDEITFFLSQEVRSVATYGKILNAIASGATKLNEIASKSGSSNTGTTSKYMDVLILLGIVEKEICFGEKANSKKTVYKIKDQLFKFHYSFIEKDKSKKVVMTRENFYDVYIAPKLDEYVSLEFENICRSFLIRQNRHTITEIGRYWYNDAQKHQDIEIDVVLKSLEALTVFECKWTNAPINTGILKNLQDKGSYIQADQLGFFSKSGYTPEMRESRYLLYKLDDLYQDA